jgi:hypothetical protein
MMQYALNYQIESSKLGFDIKYAANTKDFTFDPTKGFIISGIKINHGRIENGVLE